jgi:hypothetical protein
LAAFGATGTVANPQLAIFSNQGVELFRNLGWLNGPDGPRMADLARSVGAFALDAAGRDSALSVNVAGAPHTMQITATTGGTGIGLAEVYELDGTGRTINLSTRALVGTGDQVLIGGFVLQGVAHQRMLLRAVGPGLTAYGVSNALPDPVLTLYSGSTAIANNLRWTTNAAAVSEAGRRVAAFPLAANSEDAALLITLAPGAYTVEVRGESGGTGVALLEIYDVP